MASSSREVASLEQVKQAGKKRMLTRQATRSTCKTVGTSDELGPAAALWFRCVPA